MERAEGKIDEAGFYHLTLGTGILIDKAPLLPAKVRKTSRCSRETKSSVLRFVLVPIDSTRIVQIVSM